MLSRIDTLALQTPNAKRPQRGQWARYRSLGARRGLTLTPAAASSRQMRAIRAALSQKSANQRDQAQSAALKPVVRRPPAPVALTGMFDPSKIGQRQNASARVVAWAKDLLPDTVKQAIRAVPDTVLINAREVQCGDPNCSPVDVAIAIVFKNGRRAMCGIPMAMSEVRQEDVALCINEIHDELLACHADIPWTETRPRPRLTQQGDRALEAIARAITENVVNLDARDVAGVCTMAIELLEQLEDDAARSLAPPPFQTRPPPPSLDPSTKLLAAAQRDDANAIKACLAEGLDPSYGNSLGQTALHIAAMWGNANALDALIAAGANVNAQNQLSAASPLHIAASSIKAAPGRLACAARLLEAGADARLLDEDGDAPYEKVLGGDDFARELRALLQTAFERAAR